MTGRENLEMVAAPVRARPPGGEGDAAAVLEQIGLADAADRLVRTYSGGMRRRLDLGASLVGAPRLLLLDEPTTGLDPRSRIELWDAIRARRRPGTDVLLTTQYLDEADRLADQIVIIDHGRAVASGTPDELKRRIGGNVVDVRVRHGETSRGRRAARPARPTSSRRSTSHPPRRVPVDVGGEALMPRCVRSRPRRRARRHRAAPPDLDEVVPGPHRTPRLEFSGQWRPDAA